MRRLRIWHETRYEFPQVVQLLPHQLMLRPREGHDLRVESSRLVIAPRCRTTWHRDPHDNCVATVTFAEPSQLLSVTSEVIIQHFNEAPLDFVVAEDAALYPFEYGSGEAALLEPYRVEPQPSDLGPLREWLKPLWHPGQRVQTFVLLESLCRKIASELAYQQREAPGVQTPFETLSAGKGSCRDFACLFMEAARSFGLAARFVSGYQQGPAPPGGAGATHAWAEVYLPGAGWKGFDPTTGTLAGSGHIPVAVALRPDAVPPVAGAFIGPPGASPTMFVQVDVRFL